MPSAALPEPMNETLTPTRAASLLEDAAGFEGSLRRRTEGITLMLWGLAGPGIFLTYGAAELWDGFPSWGWSVMWLPWVLGAGATTGMLWRSAGLAAPRLRDPVGPAGYATRFLGIMAALWLIFELWDPRHHAAPLLVIGAMYLVFALVNLYYMTRASRVTHAILGAAFLAAGGALLQVPETGASFVATLLVSGALPLVGGYVLSLRG